MSEIPPETPAEAVTRETDLYAESFCEQCETSAVIEECDIGDDTDWIKAECDCGAVVIHSRVAPWPRDGMVFDGDEWRFPEGEEPVRQP